MNLSDFQAVMLLFTSYPIYIKYKLFRFPFRPADLIENTLEPRTPYYC